MPGNGIKGVLPLAVAATVVLTGCASMRGMDAESTEQLLAAAGFQARPADTSERQQHLATISPRRLERHTRDGKVVYTYADPDGCKCLYVGGPKEYSEYQRLRDQAGVAEAEAWASMEAETGWGFWFPAF